MDVSELYCHPVEYSIESGSKKDIIKALKETEEPIPPEVAHKLAEYLGDDRTVRKTGPKAKNVIAAKIEKRDPIDCYYYLIKNPEEVSEYDGLPIGIGCGGIKKYICGKYKISKSTFEHRLAEYNSEIFHYYRVCLSRNMTPGEAKKEVLETSFVTRNGLEKIIKRRS